MKQIDQHQITTYDFSRTELLRHRHSLSTKPFARFMRSLGDCYFGLDQSDGNRAFQIFAARLRTPKRANRAARRAHLQPHFPNCAKRRAMFRAMEFGRPVMTPAPVALIDLAAPERKLTGAVRRGLERGKSA